MSDYPNGHKEWLEQNAGAGIPTVAAICHAALYIGRVLEQTCWCVARNAATRPKPPQWWEEQHPDPESMED